MIITLDRDETKLISDPPQLPPFLTNRGRRERDDYVIMPDITMSECRTRTQHDNCYTLHYVWMNRVWGFFDRVERTHVNTRTYRQWLDIYPRDRMLYGISPHIQFGGAVISGPADSTFHARWVEYVRRTFVC